MHNSVLSLKRFSKLNKSYSGHVISPSKWSIWSESDQFDPKVVILIPKVVNLTSESGHFDPESGQFDLRSGHLAPESGQFDLRSGYFDFENGQFNLFYIYLFFNVYLIWTSPPSLDFKKNPDVKLNKVFLIKSFKWPLNDIKWHKWHSNDPVIWGHLSFAKWLILNDLNDIVIWMSFEGHFKMVKWPGHLPSLRCTSFL